MGRFLAHAQEVPDAAITSTATRATQTLKLAGEAGGWAGPLSKRLSLYGTGVSVLMHELHAQPDEVRVLLAVGHEPTWSDAITAFTGGHHVRFPTAAMARIDFDIDAWVDVLPGSGTLAWLVTPKLVGRL
jgi:phosphohistidine phosphatase